MKKPGALRNGAPFKDWALPSALTQARAKLKQHADGDRQFVKVLGAVLDHGLAAVEAACAEALEAGIASGDVILTVLARRQQPTAPPSITTPDALRRKIEPAADCGQPPARHSPPPRPALLRYVGLRDAGLGSVRRGRSCTRKGVGFGCDLTAALYIRWNATSPFGFASWYALSPPEDDSR